MNQMIRCGLAAVLSLACLIAAPARASVVIGGTRVVYPAQDQEVTLKLNNESKTPALLQVWVDDGDERSSPDTAKAPFTVAPPMFRMDGQTSQAVRLMYTGEALPADKESLFWVNVLEVPPKADNSGERNVLQFAFRTRIKLLFRPAGLRGDLATTVDGLTWSLVDAPDRKGLALQVRNPGAYHVNFAQVSLKTASGSVGDQGGGMVAPGATALFVLKDVAQRPAGALAAEFAVINDFGAIGLKERALTP
jgi:chaperone protein EcpD